MVTYIQIHTTLTLFDSYYGYAHKWILMFAIVIFILIFDAFPV